MLSALSLARMRRSLLSATVAIVALVPALALAAFILPSDALKAFDALQKPMDFSSEAHVQFEETYVSVWLNGSADHSTTLADARANLRMTMDVVMPDGVQGRAKAQFRVKNGVGYARLDSVSADFFGMPGRELRPYLRKWFSVPLDESQARALDIAGVGVDEEKAQEILWTVVDTLLSITRLAGEAGGSTYSLKLKPNAWQEFVTLAKTLPEQYGSTISQPTSSDLAEIRKFFSALNLHFKVMTDVEDNVTGMKAYLATAVDDVSVSFLASSTVRSAPVNVTVPASATSLLDDSVSVPNVRVDSPSARDAQRRTDVNTILNAVYQYALDRNGNLPENIPVDTPLEICTSSGRGCTGFVDLSILNDSYLVKIPRDPSLSGEEMRSGYRIWQSKLGRLTVESIRAEGAQTISVTR